MSHTALIRFAPLVTVDRINDPKWRRPGRTLYDHGALTMLPGRTSVPLIVDHDEKRVVGSVRSFSRQDDTDGPWLVAHATVDRCPAWLRKYDTKASFEYIGARQTQDFGCEITRHGWVTEVSLLSPGAIPAEPLAKVVGLWSTEASPRKATALQPEIRRSRSDDEGDREMAEFRRRCDVYGWENSERILKVYRIELGYGSIHDLMAAR